MFINYFWEAFRQKKCYVWGPHKCGWRENPQSAWLPGVRFECWKGRRWSLESGWEWNIRPVHLDFIVKAVGSHWPGFKQVKSLINLVFWKDGFGKSNWLGISCWGKTGGRTASWEVVTELSSTAQHPPPTPPTTCRDLCRQSPYVLIASCVSLCWECALEPGEVLVGR